MLSVGLTAVLAADVTGYSRLMAANEVDTLNRLRSLRADIIEPLIMRHRGEIVGSAGDSFFVAFASAVDAINCGIAWQQGCAKSAANVPDDRQMLFRIGIHLGDVIPEGGTIYGDGVNIAARLEKLAKPGGIVVSRAVRDQVETRLDITFTDLGPQDLKNIPRPVEAFEAKSREAASESISVPTEVRSSDAKLSIAVLPFDNMSGDDKETYFSDGITEDITTELSRFRELRVIARNSSFQFRGSKNDIREIGRKLDAKFVIEGSVRRAGNRLRITVQLIEAASQGHIWSDRYDREMVDVFEIQEEIARTIATRVAGHTRAMTVERTRTRPTDSLSAYDLFLRARQRMWTYRTFIDDETKALLLRAIDLDPQFAAAHALLADHCTTKFLDTADVKLVDAAVEHGRRAVSADREDAWANYGLGFALIYKRSMPDAGFYLRRAVDLNPNDVTYLGIYALWLGYVGRGEEALATIQEAIRRDPHGQEWFWDIEGILFIMQGKYSEAESSFAKMTALTSWNRCFLAFCLMKTANLAQAKVILKEFRPGTPNLTPSALMDIILPDVNPDFRRDFLDTLRSIETDLSDGASEIVAVSESPDVRPLFHHPAS